MSFDFYNEELVHNACQLNAFDPAVTTAVTLCLRHVYTMKSNTVKRLIKPVQT